MNIKELDVDSFQLKVQCELHDLITPRPIKTAYRDRQVLHSMKPQTTPYLNPVFNPSLDLHEVSKIRDYIVRWWANWEYQVINHFANNIWPDKAIAEVRSWGDEESRKWDSWGSNLLKEWAQDHDYTEVKLKTEWAYWQECRTEVWNIWFKERSKQWAQELTDQILYEHKRWLEELQEIEPENSTWRHQDKQLQYIGTSSTAALIQAFQNGHEMLREQRTEASNRVAQEIIKKKSILTYLCPPLRTVSNDAFEVAKIITPILIGLVVATTISLPPVPVVFASSALLIVRVGVSTLCRDYPSTGKDEKK